ncbi:MAG: N-acetyltransferase [Proteobacteria bacterium]|uniref:GNAT family N-acetyltransferase n=1 Tax=Rudaea sp. TaxID=2136325 RepID=UPI0037846B9C|nr:N-acetyltransferase [Pseudomonadota bacterium]
MSDEIIDNRARNRYELGVNGFTAHVDYVRTPGTIRFIHTIVPEQLGGRGIGSKLAQHVLDEARRNGEKAIPQCSFIAAYITKHREYQDLVPA